MFINVKPQLSFFYAQDKMIAVLYFPVFVSNGTSPAVTMGFLMTFVLQSCTGLSHHSSQTPWAALGAAAINANTPAIGDVPGFGTPVNFAKAIRRAKFSLQGFAVPAKGLCGSFHAGSAIASGAGTPVEGMYFFHNDNIMSTKVLTNAAGEAVTGSNGASRLIYREPLKTLTKKSTQK